MDHELQMWAEAIRTGDRGSLARAITLVESSLSTDQERADALLSILLPFTGSSRRIGITGIPGVGKSTFIDCFGMKLIEKGHRVAVLAIDPSSSLSGGSILGDKTRMDQLVARTEAYVRPSPSGNIPGGVARATKENILLCEAAGFDILLVETVGVGQGETMLADLVDCFILLLMPGTGDELQGIKRGIMEHADLLVVHKADGNALPSAREAAARLLHVARLMPDDPESNQQSVLLCSSAPPDMGHDEIIQSIDQFFENSQASGRLHRNRSRQEVEAFRRDVYEQWTIKMNRHTPLRNLMEQMEHDVLEGRISSFRAARLLVDRLSEFRPG
ncbi:MAG: methylmalonyl Co-A mutase-associated GTPase MeaB [Sphingomonadales bacterium]|nr:methylmalonyl Co-A mutase-associated GTPase MeaB [Sphingomonadales bacterium]